MTLIEATKQALEALEAAARTRRPELIKQAITALRAAIAEAEKQEPVAWADMDVRGEDKGLSWTPGRFHTQPLYTTPPAAQCQWVGLTDEEITALKRNGERYISSQDFARAIEAKLKEKKHG